MVSSLLGGGKSLRRFGCWFPYADIKYHQHRLTYHFKENINPKEGEEKYSLRSYKTHDVYINIGSATIVEIHLSNHLIRTNKFLRHYLGELKNKERKMVLTVSKQLYTPSSAGYLEPGVVVSAPVQSEDGDP